MDGYLLDTNAASVLWDARHADHGKIKSFLESVSPELVSTLAVPQRHSPFAGAPSRKQLK